MRMDHVFHLSCHLEWYFPFTMDFHRLVLQSPSIIKKHGPEITKANGCFSYLYDRLSKPPSRYWLFWLSYSLTVGQKQLHMSPEKVWPQKVLDRLSLSWNRGTIEHMLVMVHGTRHPILHCISKSFIWLFVCIYASQGLTNNHEIKYTLVKGSMTIATPKRWLSFRGHDKPRLMGVALRHRSFPGSINPCKHQLLTTRGSFVAARDALELGVCHKIWSKKICRSIVTQADPKLQTNSEFFLLFGGLFVENTSNNDNDICCCCCCSWYCSSVFFVLVVRWRWRCWRRFRCRYKELMNWWTMNLLVSLFKQSGRHLKHTQTLAWNMCRCLVPVSVL